MLEGALLRELVLEGATLLPLLDQLTVILRVERVRRVEIPVKLVQAVGRLMAVALMRVKPAAEMLLLMLLMLLLMLLMLLLILFQTRLVMLIHADTLVQVVVAQRRRAGVVMPRRRAGVVMPRRAPLLRLLPTRSATKTT